MAKKTNTLVVIILFVALAVFGSQFFSIFQESPNVLTQFDIDAEDKPVINDVYFVALHGRGAQGATTNNAGNTDLFQSSILSNTATIKIGMDTYQFNAEKTGIGTDFGLSDPPSGTPTLPYCWQRINVVKNGQQIQQLKSWGESSETNAWNARNFFKTNSYRVYTNTAQTAWIDVKMSDLGEGDIYGKFQGDCRIFINEYKVHFSENDININISTPTQTFIQGQNVTVNVLIDNNLAQTFVADLTTTFSTPTILGTTVLEQMQQVTLNPGENIIVFTLPATTPVGELNVEVNADIHILGTDVQGLNFGDGMLTTYECIGTTGNNQCDTWKIYTQAGPAPLVSQTDSVALGFVQSTEQIVSVSPNPLYLSLSSSGGCPQGYAVSSNNDYCIRNDISQLSCFNLGCPTLAGTTYTCTSSGQCAEIVSQSTQCTTNEQCVASTGGLANICDVNSGVCFNEGVYNNFVQCQQATDCITPCSGVTAQCSSNNTCAYSGQCQSSQFDCRNTQYTCGEGYSCEFNDDLGFYGCDEESFFATLNIQIILIVLASVLGLLVIIKLIKRK